MEPSMKAMSYAGALPVSTSRNSTMSTRSDKADDLLFEVGDLELAAFTAGKIEKSDLWVCHGYSASISPVMDS